MRPDTRHMRNPGFNRMDEGAASTAAAMQSSAEAYMLVRTKVLALLGSLQLEAHVLCKSEGASAEVTAATCERESACTGPQAPAEQAPARGCTCA